MTRHRTAGSGRPAATWQACRRSSPVPLQPRLAATTTPDICAERGRSGSSRRALAMHKNTTSPLSAPPCSGLPTVRRALNNRAPSRGDDHRCITRSARLRRSVGGPWRRHRTGCSADRADRAGRCSREPGSPPGAGGLPGHAAAVGVHRIHAELSPAQRCAPRPAERLRTRSRATRYCPAPSRKARSVRASAALSSMAVPGRARTTMSAGDAGQPGHSTLPPLPGACQH